MMAVNNYSIGFDIREVVKEYATVTVTLHNTRLFRFGLLFIKLGCWICNLNYEEDDGS